MAVAREQLYRVCSHDRRIAGWDIVIDAWRKEISEAPVLHAADLSNFERDRPGR